MIKSPNLLTYWPGNNTNPSTRSKLFTTFRVWLCTPLILALQRQRQVDLVQFEASLVRRMSSWQSELKNKNKNKNPQTTPPWELLRIAWTKKRCRWCLIMVYHMFNKHCSEHTCTQSTIMNVSKAAKASSLSHVPEKSQQSWGRQACQLSGSPKPQEPSFWLSKQKAELYLGW